MGPTWRAPGRPQARPAPTRDEAASTEAGKTGSSPALPAALPPRLGRDVTVVRIVLVLSALVSGLGVVCYVLAWLLLPAEGSSETIATRAISDRQGITLVLALVPVLVLVLLVASALHASFASSWGPPLLISAAGLVLVYRNAEDDERAWLVDSAKALLQLGAEPRQSHRVLHGPSRHRRARCSCSASSSSPTEL